MLSTEENELLCRVGPGTPMGELFRRYWMPAFTSLEVPEPDCPPVRVRLLGENLVAFRDTNGRVGLIAEKCAHRRASLFYGRNEECGLRCIYHGWKYDVEGNIVDTPAEPAESMIKHHVKQRAYSCREVNGLVYAYLGPKEEMPLLPDLPWITLPADQVFVRHKLINECNWLQTQEGNVDSTHSGFLHARAGQQGVVRRYRTQSNPPRFDIERTRWGVRAIVRYPAEDGQVFIRTNTFVMPVYTALPNGESVDGKLDGFNVNTEVPMDDHTTRRFFISIRRSRPIDRAEWDHDSQFLTPDGGKLLTRANDYLIDRDKQRRKVVYSGIDASAPFQDAAMTETMGPIADRENEHLGVTDTQVVALRRYYLDAVHALQQGARPPGLAWDVEDDNSYDDLYLVSALISADRDWKRQVPEVTTHVLAGAR
jgi:phenylpropionate dioxygenase-like ring-hydroxylating dioxygenase large terminal subunit